MNGGIHAIRDEQDSILLKLRSEFYSAQMVPDCDIDCVEYRVH